MLPFIQSARAGALPEIRAAVDDVQGGSYRGPAKMNEMRGPAVEVKPRPHALDEDLGKRLWEELEQDFA